MNSLCLATFLLAFGVNASFNDAASNVVSAASVLNKDIGGWSSAAGLQGALAIQEDFGPMSSALGDFAQTASSVSGDDLDVEAVSHFSAEVSKLLDNLSSKAADFASVGAQSIATGDLKNLGDPIVQIINGLIKAGGENNSKWGVISASVEGLEQKVNDANKAYSVNQLSFSPFPSVSASASSSASESSSSAASSTSAASSSSSASAKPSSTESTRASSSAKAKTSASHDKSNSTVTHSAPPVHNGAKVLTIGLGAAAIGAVALLI